MFNYEAWCMHFALFYFDGVTYLPQAGIFICPTQDLLILIQNSHQIIASKLWIPHTLSRCHLINKCQHPCLSFNYNFDNLHQKCF